MLKAGFWETEITPPLGCVIPGYYTPRYADGVKDRLYAKALAVSNGENTVAMLSIDAIGAGADITEAVTKRASEFSGILKENISVSSTHTHTGIPCASEDKADDEYDAMLIRLGADCICMAYQRMEEAEIKFGKGKIEGIAFNRIYNMADGRIQTAPEIGDKDVL